MTERRLRVVAVMTHPVQYLAPWFRHIHAHASSIDLTVVYATEPTAEQQAVGFGGAFTWDTPLREGYPSVVLRPSAAGVSVDSSDLWGIDVKDIGARVLAHEPDVVLLAGWHSVSQLRVLVAMRRAGVPVLYRGDSNLDSGSVRRSWVARQRTRLLLRQFSGYLSVGVRSREYLLAMGAAEPAIVDSPHAVDNRAFREAASIARRRRSELRRDFGLPPDATVMLAAGKLASWKRGEDVIEAAARLGTHAAVLFAGDGEQRAMLEAHARARGVHAVVTGFLNQRDIVTAYAAADVLVLPSQETWGMVVNEALACGLPAVVSTRVGCAPDLQTPDVCEVAEFGNTQSIAEAVRRVVDSREHADGAERCWTAVERCSFARATLGLETAAAMVVRNNRAVDRDARARVVVLAGNMVFAGGMERITFEAVDAMCKGGADTHVLLNDWDSRPIAALAERAGASWQVGFYNAPLDNVFRNPRRVIPAVRDVLCASAQVCALLLRRRVTHVFAVDFRAVVAHAPALALCRALGITVLLRSGVAPTVTPWHQRLWRYVVNPLVTHHVANSRFTASELQRVHVPAAKVSTISNIVPRRRAAAAIGGRDFGLVVYVGQILPEKGVLELLEAVGQLASTGRDVRLCIAGQIDGWAPQAVQAFRAALRVRADKADLKGRVQFLGWVEDVRSVMSQAAVHCCPSQEALREAFGITVIEAKTAGIPSVVCPSGGLPELITHREDGWITTGFDAPAIAEGLAWFLDDRDRLTAASQAALSSTARFDRAGFERQWQALFALDPNESSAIPVADVAQVSRVPR